MREKEICLISYVIIESYLSTEWVVPIDNKIPEEILNEN